MSSVDGKFFYACVFNFSELFLHVLCPLSSWGPSVFLNLLHSLQMLFLYSLLTN